MKQKIRIIASLLLVFCMFGGTASQAAATSIMEDAVVESQVEPRLVRLAAASAYILVDQDAGKITSKAVATSRTTTDTVNVTLYLQKFTRNTWSSVKSWNDEEAHTITMIRNYFGGESGKYRTLAVIDVYDASDNLVESVSLTSEEKLYVAP